MNPFSKSDILSPIMSEPGSSGPLYLGDFHPGLERTFARRLAELAPGGDARGVRVVVPNGALALHLRRRAAELGSASLGLRIQTLDDLARELAAPALTLGGLRPIEGWEVSVLLTEILAPRLKPPIPAEDTYFGSLGTLPGLYRALAGTLRDLRDSWIEPQDLEVAVEGAGQRTVETAKLEEVVEFYRLYVRELGERDLADGRRLVELALEALKRQPGELPGRLLIYGFYDLVERQRRFLVELLKGRQAEVFFPWGEGTAFDYARPLRCWFEDQGFAPQPADSAAEAETPLALLRRGLFVPTRPETPAVELVGSEVRLLSIADPNRETREVVRRLASEPAASAAVLLRREEGGLDDYLALNRLLGVPLHLPTGLPWRRTASGRAFTALMELAAGRRGQDDDAETLPRAAVEDLLSSSALARDLFEGGHPARWPQLLRRLGLVGGIAGWESLVERYGDESGAGESGDGEPEVGPEAVDFDPRLRHELAPLARWVELLLETTRELARSFRRWETLEARLRKVLEDWLEPGAERAGLVDALRSLVRLDGVLAPSFGAAREAIDRILDGGGAPTGRPGDEPTVAGLMSLRGVTFDRVVVPGLVEKSFPRRPRQDPILLDEERKAINARLILAPRPVRLPLKVEDSAAEERLLFRLAVGAARRELLLTWPRSGENARPLVPSTYLLEVASVLLAREADFALLDETPEPSDEPTLPLEVVPLAPAYAPDEESPHLAHSEFDLRQIDRALGVAGGPPLPENALSYLLDTYPRFRASLSMARLRYGFEGLHRITEYDGWVDSSLARAWVEGRDRGAGAPQLSASALETFAHCSFRFFQRYVLRLDSEAAPERRLDQDPRLMGTLHHHLLRNLFARLDADGLLPLTPERLEDAKAYAEPQLDRLLEERPTWVGEGPAALWEARRERLLEDLHRLLEIEAREGGDGWRPRELELSFGLEEAPPVLEIAGRRLALKGRIDRLDHAPGGLRIIDYKSGPLKPAHHRPGDLQKGQRLQLPLYRRAVSELLGDEAAGRPISGAYVGIEAASGYARYVWREAEFAASAAELEDVVGGILGDLDQGALYQVENGHYCDAFCPYSRVCGPGRRRLVEEKSEDPRRLGSWRSREREGEAG